MHLIVGLGNPGKEYEHTRHNIGFDTLDILASKYKISMNKEKFKGLYGEGTIEGEKVILLKPLTFMNLSGESLIEVTNFYKINKENIIVVYDDISLNVGNLRIRSKGSAGGHNGVKNIIAHLGSDVFPRVKVGVGQPKGNLVNHVLGGFSKEEWDLISEMLKISCEAVETIISKGTDEAMNKFNGVNLNK